MARKYVEQTLTHPIRHKTTYSGTHICVSEGTDEAEDVGVDSSSVEDA